MESVIATREEVKGFLSTNTGYGSGEGDGSGYDYSSGSGSGSGYGSGDGDGSGSGEGDGSGSGSGYGSGDGDGYGSGSGDGYGSGSGDGYSYGSGYGYSDIKALNGNIVDYIDDVKTIITHVRGYIARGYIVKEDLTFEPCFIAKVGNSFAHGKTIKEAVADAEAKEMENMPIEERIKKFIEVFGTLDSKHSGKEFYDWHNILTGSCRMGRDEFCKAHGIDLEKKYTVRYFLDITKDSYGSDVIQQIIAAYSYQD